MELRSDSLYQCLKLADNMGNKLLVICGPTATGKTRLALHLAKVFGGELVSADSRQVYKGMDIGTGKDIPKNSKFKIQNSKLGREYEFGKVSLWGYDLTSPQKGFSVAEYMKAASKIISSIEKRGKLPVLVGGTGLYIKAVVDGIPTAVVPRNKKLRQKLENKDVNKLFEILAQLDSTKAASMNLSDRKNSRRLIRAIEISQWMIDKKAFCKPRPGDIKNRNLSVLFIGLMAPRNITADKITKRVEQRINAGIEGEIKALLTAGLNWESQALSSLGYRQWRDFFEKKKTKEEVVKIWITDEIKYAKRQMTWFKKDKRIVWFNISEKGFEEKIEKKVEKWYSSK